MNRVSLPVAASILGRSEEETQALLARHGIIEKPRKVWRSAIHGGTPTVFVTNVLEQGYEEDVVRELRRYLEVVGR